MRRALEVGVAKMGIFGNIARNGGSKSEPAPVITAEAPAEFRHADVTRGAGDRQVRRRRVVPMFTPCASGKVSKAKF
jgi:hypothetical protein